MARRKQAKAAKAAIPYLRRMVEDEYVQKQLTQAATRLRDVYARGSREGSKAAEDKKLYGKVREAATSIRKAVGAMEEPPPKPRRRGRKARLIAFAVVAGLVAKRAAKARRAESHISSTGEAPASQQRGSAEPVGAPSSP